MLKSELGFLYQKTWQIASPAEREALQNVSGLVGDASPPEIFTIIARSAPRLDPRLSILLWSELPLSLHTRQAVIYDLPLSEAVARTMQLAFANELGERIDRALVRLGGKEAITQGELEAVAGIERVPWQVLSYALTREGEQDE